ncbi:hypothetical protein PM082_020487 [Marasmius tenuissimus]|nr:hypothetical protein PM082_020487 [Marasmius tenuissimus]
MQSLRSDTDLKEVNRNIEQVIGKAVCFTRTLIGASDPAQLLKSVRRVFGTSRGRSRTLPKVRFHRDIKAPSFDPFSRCRWVIAPQWNAYTLRVNRSATISMTLARKFCIALKPYLITTNQLESSVELSVCGGSMFSTKIEIQL